MNAVTTNWTNRNVAAEKPQIEKNRGTFQETVGRQRLTRCNNRPTAPADDRRVKYRQNDITAAVITRYENSRRPDRDAMEVEGDEKLRFRPDGRTPPRTETVASQDLPPIHRLDHNANYCRWGEKWGTITGQLKNVGRVEARGPRASDRDRNFRVGLVPRPTLLDQRPFSTTRYASRRCPTISEPLWPPKPKLLDMTTETFRSRASLGV